MPFPDPDARPTTRRERGCSAVLLVLGSAALAVALLTLGRLVAGLL